MQIHMHDHIIVDTAAPGRPGHFSFREAGVL